MFLNNVQKRTEKTFIDTNGSSSLLSAWYSTCQERDTVLLSSKKRTDLINNFRLELEAWV